MYIERYLENLADIFTQEEIKLVKEVVCSIKEENEDMIEDAMQLCIENILKNRNCADRTVLKEQIMKNIKSELFEKFNVSEGLGEYKEMSSLSYTMDDCLNNSLASDFLAEELSKIEVIWTKNRKRNREIIYDYIITGMEKSEIAQKYGLSTATISMLIKQTFKRLGTNYYLSYFEQFPEQYTHAQKEIKTYYQLLETGKEKQSSINTQIHNVKYIVAHNFHKPHLSSESKLALYNTYQNVEEIKAKVYQKKSMRLG